MTFTFKATDVRASNVKLLCYVAETLLRPGSPPNSADNVCISAIIAVAAQCIIIITTIALRAIVESNTPPPGRRRQGRLTESVGTKHTSIC